MKSKDARAAGRPSGLAHEHFDDRELVELSLAIVAIDGWNRFAIAFRSVPGTYEPAERR